MQRRRAFTVLVASCCVLGGLGLATSHGQVQDLPQAMLWPGEVAVDEAVPYALDGQTVDLGVQWGPPRSCGDARQWQWLPDGLLYPAYLAGGRESRLGTQGFHEKDRGWLWDSALGGHVGVLRYGTRHPLRPEGWQVDVEAAVFPRLALEEYDRELISVDFRVGVPLTFRQGPVETKFGYYHLSSHLGDEIMLLDPSLQRINFLRDVLVAGIALRPVADLRLYAEAGWAFVIDGGSEPWEFQFGVDYSPVRPTGCWPDPFLAVNGRIREEVDYGGNLTVQTGVQWRGETGRLFRLGVHYFNGKTDQYEFFREHEQQIGLGTWYDY